MKPEHLITCPQNWLGSLLWLPSFSPGADCGWMPVFAISLQKAPWTFNPCQRDYPTLRPRRIWRQRRVSGEPMMPRISGLRRPRPRRHLLARRPAHLGSSGDEKPLGETNSRESARPARPSQLIHAATAVTMRPALPSPWPSGSVTPSFLPGSVTTRPLRGFTPKIDLSVGYAVRRILPS
jgi:hypothetical protein